MKDDDPKVVGKMLLYSYTTSYDTATSDLGPLEAECLTPWHVMMSARAKRRKIESADHDNTALQRIDSAQKDDPIRERSEPTESKEEQSEHERPKHERPKHEQSKHEREQRESQEAPLNEHEERDISTLEKKQLNVSQMMEECEALPRPVQSANACERGEGSSAS